MLVRPYLLAGAATLMGCTSYAVSTADGGGLVPTDADAAAVAADAPPSCGALQIICNNKCVNCDIGTALDAGKLAFSCDNGGGCVVGCASGYASCTLGNTARCVNLKSDLNNCGSCDRACGTTTDPGACNGGQCVAKAITTLSDAMGSLLVSSTGKMFFHDQKRIYRCDAPDCANRTALYTGTFEALPLAQGLVTATAGKLTSVYFLGKQSGSSTTSLARCNVDTCTDPEIYISNLPSLALFGATDALYSFDGQRLYAIGLAVNPALATRVEIARYTSPPDRFALTAAYIFAASSANGVNRVVRTACPNPDISPCEPAVFVDLSLARGSAIDARNEIVYFNDATSSKILSCPAAGCGASPTTVATGQPSVEAIQSDGVGLAWAYRSGNALSDEIRGCTLASGVCAPSKVYTLAAQQRGAVQVRTGTQQAVYWLSTGADDSDAGTLAAIRRAYLPKP